MNTPPPATGQGDGNEKAERGARFPAVKTGQIDKRMAPPYAMHADGSGLRSLPAGTQDRHAAQRGLNILRRNNIFQRADPIRQRGGNDEPVGH